MHIFRFNLIFIIFLFSAFLLNPLVALGVDNEVERVINRQEDILERQRRQEQREQEQQNIQKEFELPAQFQPQKEGIIDDGSGSFLIKEIRLTNSQIFSAHKINKVTKDFIGKVINLNNLNEIMRRINNLYIDKGYITTKVFLKPQDVSKGVVILDVVEGKLEEIELDESFKGNSSLSDQSRKFMAFPFLENKLLNIRDIERGLAQINRLRSHDITMDIVPGTETGDSKILLKDKSDKLPIGLSFTMDNSGSTSTGEIKRQASINMDNMLGWNDNIFLQYSEDSVSRHKDRNFQSFYGALDIPYGYWNFIFSHVSSKYLSTIYATNNTTKTSGTSGSFAFAVKHHFYQGKLNTITLDAKLALKNSDSKMSEAAMEVQDKKLSVLSLGFTHMINSKYGYFSYTPTYFKGLKIFDANKDAIDIDSSTAHYQFDKFAITGYYQKNLSLWQQSFL